LEEYLSYISETKIVEFNDVLDGAQKKIEKNQDK